LETNPNRGNGSSLCYDMAYAISDVLEQVAISIEEIHGFRYWDGRSILGFVDGTEKSPWTRSGGALFGLVGDNDLSIKEEVIFAFKNIFMI
jgi:porphyrinogen peroxidase